MDKNRKLLYGLLGTASLIAAVCFASFAFGVSTRSISPNERRWMDKLAELYNKGINFESQGQWDKAEAAYKDVLAYDHREVEVYAYLGKLYLKEGRSNDAYLAIDKFLSSPNFSSSLDRDPIFNYQFAMLCKARGERVKENAAYLRILSNQKSGVRKSADVVATQARMVKSDAKPDGNIMALVHLEIADDCYIHGDFGEAREHLRMALDAQPTDSAIQMEVAHMAGNHHMKQESIALLKKVASTSPDPILKSMAQDKIAAYEYVPKPEGRPTNGAHFPLSPEAKKMAFEAIAAAQHHPGKRIFVP